MDINPKDSAALHEADILRILARADEAGCEKPFDLLGVVAFERKDTTYAQQEREYCVDPASKTD